MFSTTNSFNLFIGKSISRTASIQANDPSATTTYLADGEVLVLKDDDTPLTAGQTYSDTKSIRIVQRSGAASNPLIMGARIPGNRVTAFSGKSYVAPQEQISYIGYNTSSGTVDATGTSDYKLRIQFKHNKDMWSEQIQQRFYAYTPVSSTTAADIIQSFAQQITNDVDVTEIKAERVSDGTFTVLGGASTLTVTNGSTTATASAAGHNLVANDYVRIGGASSAFAIYKVASVSGTTIVLDQAYQGTSAVVANANVGEMSVQVNYGLRLTGKALVFTFGKFKFSKVMFDTLLGNFGTTVLTKTQGALKGSGTYEEVAELEYMAVGFDGNIDKIGDTFIAAKTDATSGTNYDIIAIMYSDASENNNTISGAKSAPQVEFIAMVDGAAQTTNLLAQLNPWMASLPNQFAAVTI